MIIIFYRLHLIMVVVLCMHAATLGQTVGAAQNSPAPLGKLVDVGGYRVHLYCMGTGSPAVIIVGTGFSFDWGLIQPEVAKSTQVCSYDHSGIGWSDSGPKDSCSLRVSEVHNALKNAGIKGPYLIVGHSLGAVVARLYAGRYPDEVAGVVFVDHAFSGLPPIDAKALPPPLPSTRQPFIDPHVESSGPLTQTLHNYEKGLIEAALAESKGKVAGPNGAAIKLGIPRSTLDLKIKQLKIKKNGVR